MADFGLDFMKTFIKADAQERLFRASLLDTNQEQEKKDTTMDKTPFMVVNNLGQALKKTETYDSAVEQAKRFAKDYDTLYILQAIAKVQSPVPEAEVTKLQ